MIHSSSLHSRTRKLLLAAGGAALIAFLALGLGGNQRYLRTSAIDSLDEQTTEAPAPASATTTYSGTGYAFEHPSNWPAQTQERGSRTVTTVGPVAIAQYASTTAIAENDIAGQLGTGVSDLYTWEGDLGQVEGNYWARGHLVAGTIAPEGERIFIAESPSGTVTVQLPAPPHDSGVAQIIKSFRLR